MRFTLNGRAVSFEGSGARRLLDVLREDLRATGTKEGCGEGECGACSVLIDGEVVDSCLIAVGQVEGLDVTTVEGLADGGRLTVWLAGDSGAGTPVTARLGTRPPRQALAHVGSGSVLAMPGVAPGWWDALTRTRATRGPCPTR